MEKSWLTNARRTAKPTPMDHARIVRAWRIGIVEVVYHAADLGVGAVVEDESSLDLDLIDEWVVDIRVRPDILIL